MACTYHAASVSYFVLPKCLHEIYYHAKRQEFSIYVIKFPCDKCVFQLLRATDTCTANRKEEDVHVHRINNIAVEKVTYI